MSPARPKQTVVKSSLPASQVTKPVQPATKPIAGPDPTLGGMTGGRVKWIQLGAKTGG